MVALRKFVGRKIKYKIPYGALVEVIKFYPRRRALVRWKGELILTMTYLLRKVEKEG